MKKLREDTDSDEDKEGGLGNFNVISSYIGPGAGQILQSVKVLTILFFILVILNIPIILLYWNWSYNNTDPVNPWKTIFYRTSLGNLDIPDRSCLHG